MAEPPSPDASNTARILSDSRSYTSRIGGIPGTSGEVTWFSLCSNAFTKFTSAGSGSSTGTTHHRDTEAPRISFQQPKARSGNYGILEISFSVPLCLCGESTMSVSADLVQLTKRSDPSRHSE